MAGGHWQIRYLTRAEVIKAVARLDPVAVVRSTLELYASGHITLPDEAYLPWQTSAGDSARSLVLPGALWGADPAIGVKVINSSLANPDRGLHRAQGLTLLFDRETAYPVAMMEAAYLSALRTSAYSALSVELLGPPELTKIAVVGCGVLGECHVRLLAQRLPGAWFALYDVAAARRDNLVSALAGEDIDCRAAGSAEQATREAQIVITTTTTPTPYLRFDWLLPGALVAHVSLDDVHPEVVTRADLVLVDDWRLVSNDDRRLLGRMYRSGELCGPDAAADAVSSERVRRVDATLADVVAGRHPGRTAPTQTVLSNPFGMGILDVALAAAALRAAQELDLGVLLPI